MQIAIGSFNNPARATEKASVPIWPAPYTCPGPWFLREDKPCGYGRQCLGGRGHVEELCRARLAPQFSGSL